MTINNTTTETAKTLTAAEFFTAILEYDLPTEMLDYASGELKKIEQRREKRKEYTSPKAKENNAAREVIYNFLVSNYDPDVAFTRDEISEGTGVAPASVSSLMRVLVDAGKVERLEVKIDNKKCKAYRATEEVSEEVSE